MSIDRSDDLQLRNYQNDAIDRNEKIFSGEVDKDYTLLAADVVPTGGGKSFIAMKEMLLFQEKHGKNTGMLYIAPSTAILSQVKLHIAREILQMNVDEMSMKDIEKNIKKVFPNLEFKCYADPKLGNEKKIYDLVIFDEAHRITEEDKDWGTKINSLISYQLNENSQQLQSNSPEPKTKFLAITATPNRGDGVNSLARISKMIYGEDILPEKYMGCEIYALDAIRDGIVNAPEVVECKSAILDSEEYQELIMLWKNAVDGSDEKKKIGEALKEIEQLIGIEHREIDSSKEENLRLQEIQQIMSENIFEKEKYIAFIPPNIGKNGDEKKETSDYFKSKAQEIREHFKNVKDKDGNPVKVSISFVSSKESGVINFDTNGNPTVVKKKDEQVLKDFETDTSKDGEIKIILSIKKLDEGVHVSGIDGVILYDKSIDSEIVYMQRNGRAISSLNPDIPLEKQKKTKVIDIAGVSMKQISRGIGEKTSRNYDLKKLNELLDFIETNRKIPNINSFSENGSDKEKVNCEKEARLAIALRHLIEKYDIYKDGLRPAEDADKVDEIMKVAKKITDILGEDIWSSKIPQRTKQPSEEELLGKSFLRYSETQKKFMDIYNSVVAKSPKTLPTNIRVKKLMRVLQILQPFCNNRVYPNGITIVSSEAESKKEEVKNIIQCGKTSGISLESFIRSLSENERNLIIKRLKNGDYFAKGNKNLLFSNEEELKNYDFAEEMAFVRGLFWTSQYEYHKNDGKSVFDEYELKDLFDLNLIQNPNDDLKKIQSELDGKRIFNVGLPSISSSSKRIGKGSMSELFNVGLIQKFEECVLTGENRGEKYVDGYDRDGYDITGYDKDGYKRFGFDRNGIHKVTLAEFDDRGFYYDAEQKKYLNNITKTEYDALGYNIYGFNKIGFERPNEKKNLNPPQWHRPIVDESGNIIGYDSHGYEKCPASYVPDLKGSCNGYGFVNKSKINDRGFYFNGLTRKFNISKKRESILQNDDFYSVGDGLDVLGYDRNGFKKVQIGENELYINRETSQRYDKNGMVYDRLTGKLKQDEDIANFNRVMKKMFDSDKEFENVDEVLKELVGTNVEKIKNAKESLKEAIKKSRIATEAFSEIEKYVLENSSDDKIKKALDLFCKEFGEYEELLQKRNVRLYDIKQGFKRVKLSEDETICVNENGEVRDDETGKLKKREEIGIFCEVLRKIIEPDEKFESEEDLNRIIDELIDKKKINIPQTQKVSNQPPSLYGYNSRISQSAKSFSSTRLNNSRNEKREKIKESMRKAIKISKGAKYAFSDVEIKLREGIIRKKIDEFSKIFPEYIENVRNYIIEHGLEKLNDHINEQGVFE